MLRKTDENIVANGTLGFYLAGAKAPCIQIKKISNNWTRKELTYNCQNDGVVTVYVHLDESKGQASLDVTDIKCIRE